MKKKFYSIAQLFLAIVMICIIYSLCNDYFSQSENEKSFNSVYTNNSLEKSDSNYVDFKKLKKLNPDIIAWINIPNSRINYPVLKTPGNEEEDYYLYKSIFDEVSDRGSLYIQKANKKDFSDSLTVIYGHNMKDGSMFSGLHKYKKKDYFDTHETIFIYLEDKALMYNVVALIKRDDTSLLSDDNRDNLYELSVNEIESLGDVILKKDCEKDNNKEVKTYIALSTCERFEKNKRIVLLAELKE